MYDDKELQDRNVALRTEVDNLKSENARLRGELIEAVTDVFLETAILVMDSTKFNGWYDSGARSSAMYYGDQLVELGGWERHPDGYGRRWFYRPIIAKEKT